MQLWRRFMTSSVLRKARGVQAPSSRPSRTIATTTMLHCRAAARNTTREFACASSTSQPQSIVVRRGEKLDNKSSLTRLRQRTQDWLNNNNNNNGGWTLQDASIGRSLLDEWLLLAPRNHHQRTYYPILDRAIWSTRILEKWMMQESCTAETLEFLHRVLHAWRLANTEQAIEHALSLLDLFKQQASSSSHHQHLRDKTFTMVFEILAQHPQRPEALDLVQSLLSQRLQLPQQQQPDVIFWNAYLHVLAKCSPFHSQASQLARECLQNMIEPNVQSYACVLHAYGNSGQPHKAQALLDHMLQQGPAPNTVCWNLVMDAWGQSNNCQQAQDVLQKMLHHDDSIIRPDQYSFLACIHAWSKSEDPHAAEQAQELLELMQRLYESSIQEEEKAPARNSNLKPTTEIVTAVLDAWSRRPNSGLKVERMLREMEQQADNVRPSLATYTTVMRAWGNTCTEEAPERAESLLWELEELSSEHGGRQADLRPGVVTYSTAIQAWSKSYRQDAPRRALSLLRRMQQLQEAGRPDAAPNTVTINSVIAAFARHGRSKDAISVLEEFFEKADTISYITVMHALARDENVPDAGEQAFDLLGEMEELYESGEKRVKPTPETYAAVILAYGSSGKFVDEAEDIFWQMEGRFRSRESDVQPSTAVCNAVLHVWSQSGDGRAPERTQSMLRWMQEQVEMNVAPNRSSFNSVLRAWSKSRRRSAVAEIRNILEEMATDPAVAPDTISYNHLMTAIKNSENPNKAKACMAVLERIHDSYSEGNHSLCPNIHSFHLVFEACHFPNESGVLKRAISLLLATTDVRTTVRTYELIAQAWIKLEVSDDTLIKEVLQRGLADGCGAEALRELRSLLPPET